jgi:hypothetical protein
MHSKLETGSLRITMKNLNILKTKRKEIIKELKRLDKERKLKQDELNNLNKEIAQIEGVPEELESIREESENFTRNMKKRPRKNYREDSNEEYIDHINKRQRRKNGKKVISPEIIEVSEEEIIESKKKIQSRKDLEDLLEELPEEELKESELEISIEEINGEIPELYFKLCEQEGTLLKGKREMMETYFEFGRKFEEKINVLLDEEFEKSIAINKIINEITKNGINHNRRSIKRKSEKARKIFLILKKNGGKNKIKKLKRLNSEEFLKFNFTEIESWEENL